MKNKFYIYLITLFLFSCSESQVNIKDLNKNAGLYYYEEKPFTGKALLIEFDTIITEITTIVEGVVEGEFNSFYLNGNLKEKGVLVNGVKDGIWEEYFDENGKISKIKNYQSGNKFGSWKTFDKNGNSLLEQIFDSTGIMSNSKIFYENGILLRETLYGKNGRFSGNLTEYYENGTPRVVVNITGEDEGCGFLIWKGAGSPSVDSGRRRLCKWNLFVYDKQGVLSKTYSLNPSNYRFYRNKDAMISQSSVPANNYYFRIFIDDNIQLINEDFSKIYNFFYDDNKRRLNYLNQVNYLYQLFEN